MLLKVNEIFYSIQGESSYAGVRCVFVRLTGCNLRCSYCDTRYAYEEGDQLEVREIIENVAFYSCPFVEVTGGEPLIQENTTFLIRDLLELGYQVLLETNGSLDISQVDDRCVKIMDIKCPLSGEEDKNDLQNLSRLTEKDEIKFVIMGREDYDYARKIIDSPELKTMGIKRIHFSPAIGKIEPRLLAEWMLEDHLNVRLQLQIHKIIWNHAQRGV